MFKESNQFNKTGSQGELPVKQESENSKDVQDGTDLKERLNKEAKLLYFFYEKWYSSLREALQTAEGIEDDYSKALAFCEIAKAQAQAGLVSEAKESLIRAIQIAEGIEDAYSKDLAFCEIAKAQAQAGLASEAKASFIRALQTAEGIEDARSKALVLCEITKENFSFLQEQGEKLILKANANDLSSLLRTGHNGIAEVLGFLRPDIQALPDFKELPEHTSLSFQIGMSRGRANKLFSLSENVSSQSSALEKRSLAKGLGRYGSLESFGILIEKIKSETDFDARTRYIYEALNINPKKAENLTMKFLGEKQVPSRLFKFFCLQLVENDLISRKTERFLARKNDLNFLKLLMARNFNQFNTVVDTLSKIKNYDCWDNRDEIFRAIDDLGSLTPLIFDRYRSKNEREKEFFAQNINKLKNRFFQNEPVKNILPKEDREILAEIIYLTYKPIGMSFSEVETMLEEIEDQTEHLSGFSFPQDGYDFSLQGQMFVSLKPGKDIEGKDLETILSIIPKENLSEDLLLTRAASSLVKIAKGATLLKPEEIKVLLALSSEQMIGFSQKFQEAPRQLAGQHLFFTQAEELFLHDLKNEFPDKLHDFFQQMPQEKQDEINGLLAKNKEQLRKNVGLKQKKEDKVNVVETSEEDGFALLSKIFFEKILKQCFLLIRQNKNKFVLDYSSDVSANVSVSKNQDLKLYVSKNVGSFFAKSSAGICTAQDTELFNRKDHFHFNVVDAQQNIRGNIQTYITDYKNEKILILRGINPNSDFLQEISPKDFCEKVFEIAKLFAKENDIAKVVISENLGNWHALSNRSQITSYLNKYLVENKKIPLPFNITSSQKIQFVYEI